MCVDMPKYPRPPAPLPSNNCTGISQTVGYQDVTVDNKTIMMTSRNLRPDANYTKPFDWKNFLRESLESAATEFAAAFVEEMPPAVCWKRGGDVGVIPTGCPNGYHRHMAECIKHCDDGYWWDQAASCIKRCPQGYREFPLTCTRWFHTFARHVYHPIRLTNFNHQAPCPSGMYKGGALCYRNCSDERMFQPPMENCGIGACAGNSAGCLAFVIEASVTTSIEAAAALVDVFTGGRGGRVLSSIGKSGVRSVVNSVARSLKKWTKIDKKLLYNIVTRTHRKIMSKAMDKIRSASSPDTLLMAKDAVQKLSLGSKWIGGLIASEYTKQLDEANGDQDDIEMEHQLMGFVNQTMIAVNKTADELVVGDTLSSLYHHDGGAVNHTVLSALYNAAELVVDVLQSFFGLDRLDLLYEAISSCQDTKDYSGKVECARDAMKAGDALINTIPVLSYVGSALSIAAAFTHPHCREPSKDLPEIYYEDLELIEILNQLYEHDQPLRASSPPITSTGNTSLLDCAQIWTRSQDYYCQCVTADEQLTIEGISTYRWEASLTLLLLSLGHAKALSIIGCERSDVSHSISDVNH